MFESLVHYLGLGLFLRWVFGLGRALYNAFIRPAKDLTQFGEWAVVTGATDGIGKAMAKELKKKGLKVMLISRNADRLAETKKELDADEILQIDYSNFDSDARQRVAKALTDKKIAVLVNNVGVSYQYPQFFTELTNDEVEGLSNLNIKSVVEMTRLVLPDMESRKRGCIVNVSSQSARMSAPLLSLYSASKGFSEAFSMSLGAELKGKGIFVQCQSPLWVTTKLSKVRHATLMTPSTKTYAALAVKSIGHPETNVSPYPVHAAISWLLEGLPQAVIGLGSLQMHLGIRKKAIKKYGEKKQN